MQRDSEPGAERGVSVVVPVFNSEASLDELCERIGDTLDSASADWELILVNDGSLDGSWKRVVALSEERSQVRGIDLTRNWGQHNALLAGIHTARHEAIVTLDDDLQNPPEEIPSLLEVLRGDVDLVYGKPIAKRHALPRRIATKVVRGLVTAITAGRIPVDIGGFRAFRASLLDEVDREQGPSFAIDIPLTRAASHVAIVSVRHDPRRYGKSNYSFGTLSKHALIEFDSLRRLAMRPGRRSPTYAVRTTTGAMAAEIADAAGQGVPG